MTKMTADSVKDKGLEFLQNNGNQMMLCSDAPADRAAALTLALATESLAPGDYTLGAGTTGRKVTIAQKNGVAVSNTGIANHRAVISPTELLTVTEVDVSVGDGRENTAAGGSSNTIIFDAGADGNDDTYNGMAVTLIRQADGSAETRLVSDYTGSSKTATVNSAWSGAAPVNGDTFAVFGVAVDTSGTVDFNPTDIETDAADPAH